MKRTTENKTCIETLIQQEMKSICKKFNIEFTEKYYEENRELYITYVIGKLQQKITANKILNTIKTNNNEYN